MKQLEKGRKLNSSGRTSEDAGDDLIRRRSNKINEVASAEPRGNFDKAGRE